MPGSPGLQAISFNTSCEIEIAPKAMQAVGQVRKSQGLAAPRGTWDGLTARRPFTSSRCYILWSPSGRLLANLQAVKGLPSWQA